MSSRIKLKGQKKLGMGFCLSMMPVLSLAVGLAVGVSGSATQAFAADKDAGADKNAWIKICDDVKMQEVPTEKDKADGKKPEEAKNKKICMTHHESLSARTGTPLVSAAVRNVEGHDKERFLVTVPLGMAIPAGVHVKVDEGKPIILKYSFCHVAGCVAEMPMTPELLKEMQAGKKIVVATIAISGKPIGFPIPLNGFDKAYKGKPIDGEKYATARKAMMQEIRKRQIELAKKEQAELLKNADKKPEKK